MKTELYRTLNKWAKAWWYYRQLREHGQHAEARKNERNSIKERLKELRSAMGTEGAYLSLGKGDSTFYYHENSRVSGLHFPDEMKEVCIGLGIPVIDMRNTDFRKLCDVVTKGPMVAIGRKADREPWNSLSYAPLTYVAALHRDAGSEVYNI